MTDVRGQLPGDVSAYLDVIDEPCKQYQSASEAIADAAVTKQCLIFVNAIQKIVPRYLLMAHSFSAPSPNEVMALYRVLLDSLKQISDVADKNKGEDSYQVLMSIQSAAESLNWVSVSPKPANCIGDAYDGCLYYANRVSRDKGELGRAWVKSLSQLLKAMKEYVIDYHNSGLLWKGSGKCPANLRDADIETLLQQLNLSSTGSTTVSSGSGAATSGDDSIYAQELTASLKALSEKSKELSGTIAKQMEIFDKVALTIIPSYLNLADNHKAPQQAEYPKVFKEMIEAIGEANDLCDKNPRDPQGPLLATGKAAMEHFNWIVAPGKPNNFVKEVKDSTLFYGNRAIKAGGDGEKAWVNCMMTYLKQLEEVLKEHYPAGLVWKGTTTIGPSSAGGPAPPPPPPGAMPPPPPPPAHTGGVASDDAGGDDGRAQLFAQLNQGTDITRGLRKVTKDMQTHKNPELRAGSSVPGEGTSAVKPKPAAAAAKPVAVQKPPRMELENDKKWIIEHYKDETITLEITDFKHTVYLYNCKNTTLVVKNKVNFISLDSCVKCGVVFDDLLSSVDLVNCKSVQIQALSKMPLLNIDKTDGAQVFLSSECLGCEIVTAKSSEMNVLVPGEDGDFAEFPMPEQFKTVYDKTKKKLVTTTSESLG